MVPLDLSCFCCVWALVSAFQRFFYVDQSWKLCFGAQNHKIIAFFAIKVPITIPVNRKITLPRSSYATRPTMSPRDPSKLRLLCLFSTFERLRAVGVKGLVCERRRPQRVIQKDSEVWGHRFPPDLCPHWDLHHFRTYSGWMNVRSSKDRSRFVESSDQIISITFLLTTDGSSARPTVPASSRRKIETRKWSPVSLMRAPSQCCINPLTSLS